MEEQSVVESFRSEFHKVFHVAGGVAVEEEFDGAEGGGHLHHYIFFGGLSVGGMGCCHYCSVRECKCGSRQECGCDSDISE